MMVMILSALIRIYRWLFSPFLGAGKCRFHPTCSDYALLALKIHGPARGVWLAASRVASCHAYSNKPFHDPVPEDIKSASPLSTTSQEKP